MIFPESEKQISMRGRRNPDDTYREISFVNGTNRELYSRYAAGEDLSRLNREWTLDVNKTGYIPTIIVVLAIIAVLAAIIFQSMN